MQSDSTFVHLPSICSRTPERSAQAVKHIHNTVFGRRYLAVAVDEAHAFRNTNKVYTAVRALREKTDLFVAMTATPVQSRATVCDTSYEMHCVSDMVLNTCTGPMEYWEGDRPSWISG
jgi:phage terminase large subunit-like protein